MVLNYQTDSWHISFQGLTISINWFVKCLLNCSDERFHINSKCFCVVVDFIICVLRTGYCLLRHWDEYFAILKWFLSRQNITKAFNTLKWFSFSTRECMCAQLLSRFWLFATLWTLACHSPLSMGFSRQEYWNGLPLPTPGNFSNLWIEPLHRWHLLHWQAGSLPPALPGKPRE